MDPLFLTAGQCRYLGGLVDATHAEAPWEPEDTVITDYHGPGPGWIFVESAENYGDEGSGVWVDQDGVEQHGPTA